MDIWNNSSAMNLKDPWLIVGWPGVGAVASGVVQTLIKKFDSELLKTPDPDPEAELEDVKVRKGICFPGNLPRLTFFVAKTGGAHDLVILRTTHHPEEGGLKLCKRVISSVMNLGVKKVVSFAALHSTIDPREIAPVKYCTPCVTTAESLKRDGYTPFTSGTIRGLNGLTMLAAQELGLSSFCLVSEIPTLGLQMMNPKSVKELTTRFCEMLGAKINLADMDGQIEAVEEHMLEVQAKLIGENRALSEEFPFAIPQATSLSLDEADLVDRLFLEAEINRANAPILKEELDRLGVFQDYEDRFLDLFRECS